MFKDLGFFASKFYKTHIWLILQILIGRTSKLLISYRIKNWDYPQLSQYPNFSDLLVGKPTEAKHAEDVSIAIGRSTGKTSVSQLVLDFYLLLVQLRIYE
jgi:hypothetical protein